jgi:glycosyltransferase involved in cell wall biosynthesis
MRMVHMIRKHHISVLHLCTAGSLSGPKDWLMVTIARWMGLGTVIHYHTGEIPDMIGSKILKWKMNRLAMKRADCVVLLDERSLAYVREKLPDTRIEIVPNPVDPEILAYPSPGETGIDATNGHTKIVYVGRVSPVKGIRELVQACMLLEGMPFELSLVGSLEESFRQELVATARGLRNGDWLKIKGEVGKLTGWAEMQAADVFAFPSHTEGFPYAVLEAMVLGKPIVASRVGAIPQMLCDGTDEPCGVLIEPKHVHELIDGIHALAHDRARAEILGQRARRKALTDYNPDLVLEKYVGLWKTVSVRN